MKLTEREKAYHDGYKQGRFDEYAERMGYDQAEKVKVKIDKQKNCPYCHLPYEIMPINVRENDYDDEKWWACYTNRLGYVQRIVYMQRECDFEPWTIAIESNPKFCEMCGRPLNEEE